MIYKILEARNPQMLEVGDFVPSHQREVIKIDRKRNGAFLVTYDNNAVWDAAKPGLADIDIHRPMAKFRESGSLVGPVN